MKYVFKISHEKQIIMIGDESPGRDGSRLVCEGCLHYLDSGLQGASGNFRRPQTFHRNSLPSSKPHRKRHASSSVGYVYDGPLHSESTYTAYLDAVGTGKRIKKSQKLI